MSDRVESSTPTHVLIVDDMEDNLIVLEKMLQRATYQVYVANNGKQAMEILRNNSIELIISDILMPVMDGYELCRQCQNDATLARIPFIFYTATYTGGDDRSFGLSLGAARFIIKPAKHALFLQEIDEVLKAFDTKSLTPVVTTPALKNGDYQREYNVRLIHKLEDKLAQLQLAETSLVNSNAKLKSATEVLQRVIGALPARVFWKDCDSRFLGCNLLFAQDAGFSSPEELIGKTDDDMVWKEWAAAYRADDQIVMQSGSAKLDYEEPQNTPEGTTIWLSTSKVPLKDEQGRIIGVLGVYIDITERKEAEAALRIAATAFESQAGMLVTDANATILQVNRSFTQITGYTDEEAIGRDPGLLRSGRHDELFFKTMWACINETGQWEGEIWNQRKDGETYPVHLTITAVKDELGKLSNYVGTMADISSNKAAQEEIQQLAFYDTLTGLPNRRLLSDRLSQALVSCDRSGQGGALLFLDLDNFKKINDTLGHRIGDLLLQDVARRLVECVRKGDTVARLGGDEFVVILEDLSKHELEAAVQCELIGNKILSALAEPYQLEGHTHHGTTSIGITLFNDHLVGVEGLVQQADIAMYQAKREGRNTLRFFNEKMHHAITERAVLERELRTAIERQQFQLYYQIQTDSSGRLFGAEALIRWNHPERGLVSPMQFIPLAEETELILQIGNWVLDSACARIKAWQQEPVTQNLVLSVNVSAKQFYQTDFFIQVQAAVQQHGINPKLLELELTESMLLENVESTIKTMCSLKELGVQFSLDDFGTGYSSLQYLKRLPFDQLKIDQSFVQDIVTDIHDQSIVRTIIAMANSLSLHLIAEGVETDAQHQRLIDMGCNCHQGYLFSKPVPLEEFDLLLKKPAPYLNKHGCRLA